MTSRPYRFTALGSGALRMWRAWRIAVPVVIVNALVQGLLQWIPFDYDNGLLNAVTAIASAIVFGVAFALVAASALQVMSGPVHWRAAVAGATQHWRRYALWALGWLVVIALGMLAAPYGALAVAALTVFVLFAALEGASNPLAVNFRVIGRRWARWLITCIIVGIGLLLGVVISGFVVFFNRPPTGVWIAWLIGGLLAWWITTAWALVYRSANGGEPSTERDVA